MGVPSAPTSVPVPASLRRRRWRVGRSAVLLLGAALVLWLAGQGLGLVGRGQPATAEPPTGAAAQVAGATSGPVEHASQDGTTPGDGGRSSGPPAAPAGESGEVGGAAGNAGDHPGEAAGRQPAGAPAAEGEVIEGPAAAAGATPANGELASADATDQHVRDPSTSAPDAPPLVDADRFHSLCSIVELRVSQGELGDAAATLANLRSLPLDERQRAATDDLQRRLTGALHELGSAWHGSLQRGEVLAARSLAGSWFAARDGLAELPPPLRNVFAAGFDWRRPLLASEAAPPQPAPLDRRRRVRLDWRGELVLGSVAQARADQVTVRVETARGQSYPTVPAVACEPLDADADEAVEMALVAVAAGEPLLARLWWARALLLGVDPGAPRPSRLHDLLR